MNKKLLLLPVAALGILAVAGSSLALYKAFNKTYVVDESKLYIGIPKEQGDLPVYLTLNATSYQGVSSVELCSDNLSGLKGQPESMVFYDYASDPLLSLGEKDIGEWLADDENSLKASTRCLGIITSEYVDINESGVWFINVAPSDGETPSTSHANCYKEAE